MRFVILFILLTTQLSAQVNLSDHTGNNAIPDFTNWDMDVSDDFDGDYESLSNKPIDTIVQQFSGQFLLDPNEINGWGIQGFVDNSNTQDLGNVGATNLNRLTGGFSFPFDVKLIAFRANHQNSNAGAQPWGWVITSQQKANGSNTVTTIFHYDESFDRGNGQFSLRDYDNTLNQISDIDLNTYNIIIPAGEVISVSVGAPTAQTTNRYVRVMSGYLMFEKVN